MADIASAERHALAIGPFGSDLKTSDYCDQGVPIVFVRDVQPNRLSPKGRQFVSARKAQELSAHAVRPGDLVITKMGLPPCVAAVYPEAEPPGVVTADIIKMSVDGTLADSHFVAKYLNSDLARRQVAGFTFGITRPKVTLRDFKEMLIPLPPLSEQRRVAEVLDRAEALRAKRRAALAQLDTLTQAMFLDLFGDPATNPRRWPLKTIGEMALKLSDGPFGSNLKSAHYTETGVRVVRLQNIGVGEFLDTNRAYISEQHFAELAKHACRSGDILVGTLGDPNLRACIQPEWLSVALNKADCVQLRPDERVANAFYLCALLNQPATERMAKKLVVGQTRLRISMGRLRGLIVPVPPIEIQRDFARRIAAVAALKRAHRASLAEMDALFASLQHRAFRGEL